MLCIPTIKYYVLFNGITVGLVVLGRGLHQGCPLSPYLFIVCVEGLSAMIRDAETRGALHGCSVCRNAPSISHLFPNGLFFGFLKDRLRKRLYSW